MSRPAEPHEVTIELDHSLAIQSVTGPSRRAWEPLLGLFFPDVISTQDRITTDHILRAAQERMPLDRFAVLKLPRGTQYMRLQMLPLPEGWTASLEPVRAHDAVYELVVSRQQYQGVLRATATGIASLNQRYHILNHNERFFGYMQFRSQYGVTINEDGLRGRDLIGLCSDTPELAPLAHFLSGEAAKTHQDRVRLVRLDRVLEFRQVPTLVPHFGKLGFSLLVSDVSAEEKLVVALAQLKKANDTLNTLATQDPLTGLLNRRGIEDALSSNASLESRVGFRSVALLIDLDNFKAINTDHGYEGGDAILAEVARRLTENTRSSDIIGRIGGDEFLIVLPDTELDGAIRTGQKVCAAIKEHPVVFDESRVPVAASLGAAELPAKVASIREILRLTRKAIETSKQGGKGVLSVDAGGVGDHGS